MRIRPSPPRMHRSPTVLGRAGEAPAPPHTTPLIRQPWTLTAHCCAPRRRRWRTHGETLGNIKNEIMGMIANIEGQQFAVSEDWKVTDVSGLPEEIKQFREPARSTFDTTLQAEVQGFEQAHQGVTATLTGHATSIGGFQFPQSPRKPSWCPPEEMPGRCLSDAQGGGTSIWPTHTPDGKLSPGAFNDGIQIDTSHASIRGLPDQWTLGGADDYGIPHDWPMPLTGSTGTQPFLPKWQQDMIAPSVPPNPPLTVQTPNGQMTLLPPLRDFPAPMPMPPSPFRETSALLACRQYRPAAPYSRASLTVPGTACLYFSRTAT